MQAVGVLYLLYEKSIIVQTKHIEEEVAVASVGNLSRIILGGQVGSRKALNRISANGLDRLALSLSLCLSLGRLSCLCRRGEDYRWALKLSVGLS